MLCHSRMPVRRARNKAISVAQSPAIAMTIAKTLTIVDRDGRIRTMTVEAMIVGPSMDLTMIVA